MVQPIRNARYDDRNHRLGGLADFVDEQNLDPFPKTDSTNILFLLKTVELEGYEWASLDIRKDDKILVAE